MDRAVVRSIQVFLTVFFVLTVVTLSGRVLLADGADNSFLGVADAIIGDLLVLFVGLGLIWVLPNRIMRAELKSGAGKANASTAPGTTAAPGDDSTGSGRDDPDSRAESTRGQLSVIDVDASGVAASSYARKPSKPTGLDRWSWSVGGTMLVAIVPATLIVVVGALLYFR